MSTRSFSHGGLRYRYVARAVTPPAVPTIGTATAGTLQATVAFTGVANANGYIVTASTGQSASGASSPITVTGLASGVAVTFTAQSFNGAGSSAASSASNSVSPTSGSPGSLWGTLQTDKNAISRADDEAAVGLQLAMVEQTWNTYETADGTYASAVVSDLQSKVAAIRAAGLAITWSFGAHYQPTWLSSQTALKAKGEDGVTSANVDLVFNATARSKWEAYVTRTHADFDLSKMRAIRLTSGSDGEFKYQHPGTNQKRWWAFSTPAQTGTGLASGQSVCPFPGWKPGGSDTSISTANVSTWLDWYVQSLVNYGKYQMDYLTGKGFTGLFEVVMPGQGVRPNAMTNLVNSYLAQLSGGSLAELGVIWYLVYEKLAAITTYKPRIVGYCSSFGDQSGTSADNTTDPADASIAYATWKASSSYNVWSAAREHAYLAQAQGLKFGGENTGYSTGLDSHYRDATANGLMAKAVTQAKAAQVGAFYWAHDPYFWNGYVSLANYATDIATL